MKEEDKFHRLDKEVSQAVMEQFKGKVVDSICGDCKGKGCEHCNNEGHYKIQY